MNKLLRFGLALFIGVSANAEITFQPGAPEFKAAITAQVDLILRIDASGHCKLQLSNHSNEVARVGGGWWLLMRKNPFKVPGAISIQARDRQKRVISISASNADGWFSPAAYSSEAALGDPAQTLNIGAEGAAEFPFELSDWIPSLKTWTKEAWMRRECADPCEYRFRSLGTRESGGRYAPALLIETPWLPWASPPAAGK